MSRPIADTPKRRARRQFTHRFKASAVRLVLDEGKTVGAVARDLDLTETGLREWVKRARADRTHGRTGLTTAARTSPAVNAERQCCRFLRFTITVEPAGGPMVLELTAPAGAAEFMAALL